MTLRTALGFLIALTIALIARRTRSLSTSGAVAAVVIGTISVAAGWNWGALLILYFGSSTVLSHFGRAEKERRTESIVAKSGERDAIQVLANGFVFTIAAVLHAFPLGAGALAASAADTWATEVGTLYGRHPRSILSLRRVRPGTSGGVSVIGTLAAIAGACFIGIIARATTGDRRVLTAIVIGGVAGAFVDTIFGATVQSRRWCESCRVQTERNTHSCGTVTTPRHGLAWLDNDAVNFVATLAGGLLAALLSR